MVEQDGKFFQETDNQLRNLEVNLRLHNLDCSINLLGVAHEGRPNPIVFREIDKADVITLELTRHVVQAGLTQEKSQVLRKSLFWRTVIKQLRNKTGGEKIIGIEINPVPRIDWKRLSLHNGERIFSPAPITIEVERESISELSEIVRPDELNALERNNWLVTENGDIAYFALETLTKKFKKLKKGEIKYLPVPLSTGVRIVSCDLDQLSRDLKRMTLKKLRKYPVAFITPPPPSQIEACKLCRKILRQTKLFEDYQIDYLISGIMGVYLLSPVSITESREIAHATNQYVRGKRETNKPSVNVLHIGGACHTSRLFKIFSRYLSSNDSEIQLKQSYDSKSARILPKISMSYFKNHIPLLNILSASRINNREVEIFPEIMRRDIEDAIFNNREEFEKFMRRAFDLK